MTGVANKKPLHVFLFGVADDLGTLSLASAPLNQPAIEEVGKLLYRGACGTDRTSCAGTMMLPGQGRLKRLRNTIWVRVCSFVRPA